MKTETVEHAGLLLKTKLHPPTAPADLVPRERLVDLLEAGRACPLTLVSASAGYGKSALIAEWLERSDWPSAWLSLDVDDSDLRQFLTYFVAAVRTVFPDACDGTLRLTRASQLPPPREIALILTNELDALDQALLLVLDDYHRIDADSPVNELLQRVLERPPIPLHLVIVTRRDPSLALAGLRAKGQISEIRMLDLRFDMTETRTLLEFAIGLTLSEDALANLDYELEGWVAGLRLISIAVRGNENADSSLRQLRGGVQQTQEFMVHEIIAKQPPHLAERLLKSAILDRFCGDLCDAVFADGSVDVASDFDGDRFLRAVRDANLFVIALDAQGEWFRFHHLFQELLGIELERRMAPKEIARLHLCASRWFESHGLIEDAIRHALKAGDLPAAAEIVERNAHVELDNDRWFVVRRWLDLLPGGISQQRPTLLLIRAWVAYFTLQLALIPPILERIDLLLGGRAPDPGVARELDFFKGILHYWQGDAEKSLAFAEQTLETISEHPGIIEGNFGIYVGLALCMNGQKESAIGRLNDLLRNVDLTGPYQSQLLGGLAFVRLLSGELYRAGVQSQRLADVTATHDIENSAAWSSDLLGCVHFHANELDQALNHFMSIYACRYRHEPRPAIDALAGLALTQALLGRWVDADETANRLMGFARELGQPEYLTIAHSCRARLHLLRGEPVPIARWMRSVNTSPTPDELFLWLEVPAITRARILIALGTEQSLGEATDALAAVRRQSEKWCYTCQTIEVAVLQSLVLEKQGRSAEALEVLQGALSLAEPGAWIRPFIELGNPMEKLLERLAAHTPLTEHMRHIFDAFGARRARATNAVRGQPGADVAGAAPAVTDLTPRELDILELVAQRLQNKEIAARLFVSPETVKTHLKHLFDKLGVTNRREAAAKAAEIIRPALVESRGGARSALVTR